MSHDSPADPATSRTTDVARRAAGPFARAGRRLVAKIGATRGFYEAALIFLVLLGIEWVTPGHATLARIAPHPFWIPVILMSVQNGSASGLAAAGLATVLAWVAGWPAQTPQEDFYTYSLRVWREPILWIIGALVIGSQRNRQIRDRQALEERLRLTEEQRNTLGAFCSELQAELGNVERARATARHCPVEQALDALHDLRTGGADWPDRLRDLATCWLGEARWSLHLSEGGVLHPRATDAGEERAVAVPNFLLARLHAAARTRTRPLSVFDARDAALLDGYGIFACNVRSADRGTSLGLLIVASVEPSRLTPATAAALPILADAIGMAIVRADLPGEAAPTPPAEFGEVVNLPTADTAGVSARLEAVR